MEQNRKITSITFTIIFLLLIAGLGIINFKMLADFYINDETDYNDWSADLGSRLDTDIATSFYGKFRFVNINGAVRNLLEQREMNGVVKLNNGYLFTPMPRTSDETLQAYANNVISLNNYLKTCGIPLLYAVTPYTSSKYDPQLPTGTVDYGNDNIDRFIETLKHAGIDTMDFREMLHEDGIDQYDMMYKTDHHWNTAGGFYAYGKFTEYLQEKLNCEIDERIGDINNYTVTTYKKWHLGSNGQRTGIYYAGIDDFDLVIPNFESTIQHGDKIGRMQDLIIHTDVLQNREYTSRYTYDNVYGYSLSDYVNLDCPNNKKLLIVEDSFGKVVNPYLIMTFGEIRCILNYNSSDLTREYIDSYKPDAVIILIYPSFLSERSDAFDFQGF